MNEEPDNFVFSRLLTSFQAELYELMGTSWCQCVRQGFEPHRVERALVSSALSEIFDLAVESMGPEECARPQYASWKSLLITQTGRAV
jgi:hypothetical protein